MNKPTSYWTWIFLFLALIFIVVIFLVIRKQKLSRDSLPPQEPVSSLDSSDSSGITSPNQNTPTTQVQNFIQGKAQISSLTIDIAESFPLQVFARVSGNYPDGCTSIDSAIPRVDSTKKLIEIVITTKRPREDMCTEALVPYTYSVTLPVTGLSAGTYTVLANGVTEMFILPSDNSLDFHGDKG